MKEEKNAAEKFVEENLEEILSEYDDDDIKNTDARTLANEFTEDFDSILLARVEDAEVVEMAKRLGREKGDMDVRSLSDVSEARFYVLAEIARIISKKIDACDKKRTRRAV